MDKPTRGSHDNEPAVVKYDGPWRAVKLPHNYNDGTTFRWAVEQSVQRMGEEITINYADWLTEESARLIAAAPDMAEAIEQALDDMRDSLCTCEATKEMLCAALAKATGAA